MNILFISTRFPYPPITGDKVIPYQRLKHLSKNHEITLLCFSNSDIDKEHLEEVSRYCKDVHVIPLRRVETYSNLVLKGLGNIPLQVLYFESRRFKAKLEDLLRITKYDLIYVFMLRIAPYISEYKWCPKIIELIDSMELNMRRRASLERGFKKWFFKEEARRLSIYEKTMVQKFDSAIVVSNIDKRLIGTENLNVIPLGVDTTLFKPVTKQYTDENIIIFSGNMSYFPNEKAVSWFVKDIFPLILKSIPTAKFWVAGGGVSNKIKHLEDKNKTIRILGYVDSMPSYICQASVSVAPMIGGSGMQFKILEALACGVPVVGTSMAKGDIQLSETDGLFVVNEPDLFADKVVQILLDKDVQESVAQKAPQAIREKYSWDASNLAIENIYSKLLNK